MDINAAESYLKKNEKKLKQRLAKEKLGTLTRTLEESIINRTQEIEEIISGIEGIIKEMDISAKENVKAKKFSGIEHARNMRHYEKKDLTIIVIEEKYL